MKVAEEISLSQDSRMLAWRAFLQSHAALMAVLEKELEEQAGLPLSQYEVLLHLQMATDDGLRMQDLASSILLSKSGVTRLVDRMADAGLVERAACQSDRRVTYARLTTSGHRALEAAAPIHLRGIEDHFLRFLSPEEAEAVTTALLKVFRHSAAELGGSAGVLDASACS
jgi:DNA-binding MarR family transcriptional regulator